ncbi:MAG: cobalamin-dependent protein [Actinobacteria bacterium]|nr:cobalamin-dependent protein [Actinomycetota bacterium]
MPPDAAGSEGHLDILVTSVASDSHTWNLIYLQLLLQEQGHRVRNLGSCVPVDMLLAECLRSRPDLVVVSSVNGHGHVDGMAAVRRLRDQPGLAGLPVVIGGQLGIAGPGGPQRRQELTAAGFDEVFEGAAGLPAFRRYLSGLRAERGTAARTGS